MLFNKSALIFIVIFFGVLLIEEIRIYNYYAALDEQNRKLSSIENEYNGHQSNSKQDTEPIICDTKECQILVNVSSIQRSNITHRFTCVVKTLSWGLTQYPSPICMSMGAADWGRCPEFEECPFQPGFAVHFKKNEHKNNTKTNQTLMSDAHIIIESADATQWFLYGMTKNLFSFPKKESHHLFAAIAYESTIYTNRERYYEPQKNKEGASILDYTLGYSPRFFDMHAGYWPGDIKAYLNKPLPFANKTNLICVFISQPHIWNYNRTGKVIELAKYLPIDSFGSWNKTKEIPKMFHVDNYEGKTGEKILTMRDYKFALSYENAIDQDWVSEKFWEAIVSGTLPVYFGAPNIKEYFPVEKSYINAADFNSTEDLANYILYLSKNESAYQEYFAWKEKPLPQKLFDLQKTSFRWNNCRLCEVYYYWKVYPNESQYVMDDKKY